MSFEIILLDGDALGLSRSNTVQELADAANKISLEDKSVDLLENIGPGMRQIMGELIELYGTLRDPTPGCPWASWPPYRDAQGRRFDLSVGWRVADEVLSQVEKLCANSTIVVLNPQPPEKKRKNIDHEKDRFLGKSSEVGLSIYVKRGHFGVYFMYGGVDEVDEPEMKVIREGMGMDIDTVTMDDAIKLSTLPRVLGKDANDEDVIANWGPNGPNVKYEKKFYLSSDIDPFSISLDEAKKLIDSGDIKPHWRG